jgi:hypothetical protein
MLHSNACTASHEEISPYRRSSTTPSPSSRRATARLVLYILRREIGVNTVAYSTCLLSWGGYTVEESSCKGRPDNATWQIRGRDRGKGGWGKGEGGRGRSREVLILRLCTASMHLSKGALGYLGCSEENLIATPTGRGRLIVTSLWHVRLY